MPALADLKHQMRDLATKAQTLVDDDKLTTAEKREQYERIQPDIKALADQIKDEEFLAEQRKSLGSFLSGADEEREAERPARTKSIGGQLVEASEFKAIAERLRLSPQSRVQSAAIEVKGMLDTASLKATLLESGLTGPNTIAQDRQPGILPILFERPVVADLMPNGTTTSNTVRYAKESTATNAAAAVAEGTPKPASTLNFTVVDEPVRKIATSIKVSNEMLDDLDQMQSYMNGRLALFVRLQEEAQLLTGSGSGVNLTGLLNRSGLTAAQAKSTDTIAAAVHKEITKIRVASFLEPDSVVFHVSDWEKALLEADANGQYFGGGPFRGPYGVGSAPGALNAPSYWGLRVVSTTAETQGTALVGAFSVGAQVFRRTGLTVEMTNSNEDDFLNNLLAIRAEERLALAVYRPSAFGTVTGL